MLSAENRNDRHAIVHHAPSKAQVAKTDGTISSSVEIVNAPDSRRALDARLKSGGLTAAGVQEKIAISAFFEIPSLCAIFSIHSENFFRKNFMSHELLRSSFCSFCSHEPDQDEIKRWARFTFGTCDHACNSCDHEFNPSIDDTAGRGGKKGIMAASHVTFSFRTTARRRLAISNPEAAFESI
jgi:hypothetical protein